jgi:hypothetical protein
MPDVLHWLGVRRIDRLVSMSNMKYDAIVGQGIEVGERVAIPDGRVPGDASVEMEAKKAAGYYAPEGAGDVTTDAYHRGFRAYRWLLDRTRPPLWLHGHTTTALVPELLVSAGSTTVVNVTGAVLVELLPPTAA